MMWGSVVVVVEDNVVEEDVVEDEVVEEVLGAVVVEEEMLVEVVVVELSVVVDTATVVDVPALAVVDDETPPPHAAKKTRPVTTIVLMTMRTKRLLIGGSFRGSELPETRFTGRAIFPAYVPAHPFDKPHSPTIRPPNVDRRANAALDRYSPEVFHRGEKTARAVSRAFPHSNITTAPVFDDVYWAPVPPLWVGSPGRAAPRWEGR